MDKNETLSILKEMRSEMERMTDDQLFRHLIKSSETFRREIDRLELLLSDFTGCDSYNMSIQIADDEYNSISIPNQVLSTERSGEYISIAYDDSNIGEEKCPTMAA
ncbi:MAG: hypothetical protein IJW57_12220 [Spirochaetaceae bacterium]|nr:hypothetical protein [Spirochaetaceae bacterium]